MTYLRKAISMGGYDGDRLVGGLRSMPRSVFLDCEAEDCVLTLHAVRVLTDV